MGSRIALLIVAPVARAHYPLEIKRNAVGAGIVEREQAFTVGGDDAYAVELEAPGFLDQPELDEYQ